MSVVIVGGHDRMVCRYKDICKEFNCNAKVYTQPKSNLDGEIGQADLIVLFTSLVSHKMAKIAKKTAEIRDIAIVQSHSGSSSSLRSILSDNL